MIGYCLKVRDGQHFQLKADAIGRSGAHICQFPVLLFTQIYCLPRSGSLHNGAQTLMMYLGGSRGKAVPSQATCGCKLLIFHHRKAVVLSRTAGWGEGEITRCFLPPRNVCFRLLAPRCPLALGPQASPSAGQLIGLRNGSAGASARHLFPF